MAISDKERAQAQVDEARRQLDDDLATLTDRLPAAAVIAQAGAAGGIGLAVLGAAAKQVQKKLAQRSEEQALTREAEIQARAIAAAIAAAGLHGQHQHDAGHAPGAAASASKRPKVSVPVPPPTDGDDRDGAPWGIILLIAGLVAAVVALVSRSGGDDDIWQTPGQ